MTEQAVLFTLDMFLWSVGAGVLEASIFRKALFGHPLLGQIQMHAKCCKNALFCSAQEL